MLQVHPESVARARAALLESRPTAPLITDYSQGRVELSNATFDNWVSKTVNLLRLEVGVDPGAAIRVDLPLHWMSAVWLVAVWEAGADISLEGRAEFTVGTGPASDILVVLDAFGMAAPPPGASADATFPADARVMPDQLVLPAPESGGIHGGPDAGGLVRAALDYADRVGLEAGGRLLSSLSPSDLVGVLATIASPVCANAAVVYATDGGSEGITAIANR